MKTQGGLSVRDYSRASLSKAASLATSHETTGLAWLPVHCHKLGLRPTQLSPKWKATDRPQRAQPGAWTCSGPQILCTKTGRDTSFPNSQTSSPLLLQPAIWTPHTNRALKASLQLPPFLGVELAGDRAVCPTFCPQDKQWSLLRIQTRAHSPFSTDYPATP